MSKDSHFTGQPVYSQVLKLLDKETILQISRETKGSEAYVRRFDGYQHLVVMLFGILKHFDSLRELEIGMKAEAHILGHLGMNYLVRLQKPIYAVLRSFLQVSMHIYWRSMPSIWWTAALPRVIRGRRTSSSTTYSKGSGGIRSQARRKAA